MMGSEAATRMGVKTEAGNQVLKAPLSEIQKPQEVRMNPANAINTN